MLSFVRRFDFILAVILTLAYAYQLVYLFIGLARRHRRALTKAPGGLHRYAAVISARNEANVIAGLIQSLKAQDYPSDRLDIYVIADNCTDDTADVARQAGAFVYERFNKVQVGKGYALDYLFRRLRTEGRDVYDAFFVFDADNYVDPGFVAAMDRTFSTGRYDALTCYRNSKNFGDNWISAGYGLWFLREARFLNAPRMALGTNCHVSGTGFLVSAKVVRENGGWPFHLLTEDIEFSISSAIQGRRIGYCEDAVIYDEQPVTFQQSWDQRLRWSKGFYQVDLKYGIDLMKNCLKGGRKGFSCYDMLMTVAPGMLLTLLGIVFNAFVLFACVAEPTYLAHLVVRETTHFLTMAVVNFYLGLFLFGVMTTITEWKQIHISTGRKLLYLFTFPIFMFTYVPISVAALVRRVEWKPIYHGAGRSLRAQE
ncbi:glycosyltransferase family 2 protein [Pseudoflavonifractor sp. MSJ-37]|uniref:glycosyltransferase family 2 protein n=1 Tax=Pseudoflavonifractor sp. MSJ-37 TaxID=2841531 RepID=UPI001C100472|nr:glycosyltransferase family 2 protein [Pseudoflavonifractor sp. MSJ-37]MBU5435859.1 glycosyltransferase [Pseudoflavonifractor sp. MSJ-37]